MNDNLIIRVKFWKGVCVLAKFLFFLKGGLRGLLQSWKGPKQMRGRNLCSCLVLGMLGSSLLSARRTVPLKNHAFENNVGFDGQARGRGGRRLYK